MTELLDLAWYTGRRITPILSLTYADLRLDTGPTGSIKWPGETDKNGEECMMDLHPVARAAIDRVLAARPPFRGQDAPLFPAVRNPSRPMDKSRASTWLRRAEKLAGLERFEGSSWHAFRRGWATRHKDFPDVDVARAGGWRGTEVLTTIYQQATDMGVRKVLTADVELREAQ